MCEISKLQTQMEYNNERYYFDNNFMKVTKERNPYLRRISSDAPHKYSYQMNSGKYLLLAQDGTEREINKIGTFHPRFRKNFSGFATPHERYEAAKEDATALHYTPNLSFHKQNSYYTPVTRKFVGYMQLPYKIKGRKMPQFLSNPDEPHQFKNQHKEKTMKKSQSQQKQKMKNDRKNASMILDNATLTFIGGKTSDHYFQTSFLSMTESKPLPKQAKKTCYNYRCKYLKHFTFDEKGKTQSSTRFTKASSTNQQTLSKSFYDKQFELQKKQFSAIQVVV